ncbi:MAG: metalloregulator ArsR/SmtB family transcription factor [Chloroflexaceae bacterium]|nr:metalloregulator ArsR/SmtB family transcription factor [Chloroflexaceae bacterium]NJO05445.1 metalloregulator ArsR/SmtB family transcription factor [Chloroflexaceae bacterium]
MINSFEHSDSINQPAALQVLKLLADETRWRLINELRISDRQVGELVDRLGLTQNLVSYHLGLLRQAGFVHAQRSDADGRALYYSLDLEALKAGCRSVAETLRMPFQAVNMQNGSILENEAYLPSVVFVCRNNSVRSQMAEAWLRHLSGGRVQALSAGTESSDVVVNPFTIQVMDEVGIDIHDAQAKHFNEVAMDETTVVITVCDMAREDCRAMMDQDERHYLHWSVPPAARLEMGGIDTLDAFRMVRDEVRQRVEWLLTILPLLMPNKARVAAA